MKLQEQLQQAQDAARVGESMRELLKEGDMIHMTGEEMRKRFKMMAEKFESLYSNSNKSCVGEETNSAKKILRG